MPKEEINLKDIVVCWESIVSRFAYRVYAVALTREFAVGFFLVSCFLIITFSLFGNAKSAPSFEKTILSILLSTVVSATLWVMSKKYDRVKHITVTITIFLSKWVPILSLLFLTYIALGNLYGKYSYRRDFERARKICASRYDEYMDKESHLGKLLYGCFVIINNESTIDVKEEAIHIVISEDERLKSR